MSSTRHPIQHLQRIISRGFTSLATDLGTAHD